jgi:putative DNA primase/helicase
MFTFKRLYQEAFSAYPTAKIMIVTNHLPAFKDTSDGIWRRLLIAPFDRIIPKQERIKGFAKKIIKTEMSGVLKWALEGARKVEKYGFVVPEICQNIVEEYRREAVPELAFFDENFEACDADNYEISVPCSDLRTYYEAWCREQGCGIKAQKKLNKTMKKLFPHSKRERGRRDGKLTYLYAGVKLKDESVYNEGPYYA